MKIDGKLIALELINQLKIRVQRLKEGGITPHLYIITFGEDTQTESYLKQKKLRADQIGAKITIKRFGNNAAPKQVYELIEKLNKEKTVNGIIIQRPLPKQLDPEKISLSVNLPKDVDGFHPKSTFSSPVALAVFELLKMAAVVDFGDKDVVLAGKGVTAGKPIINFFARKAVTTTIVDSKTANGDEIFKNADIIISSVGKKILSSNNIKKGVILIGVGMHVVDGKLKGDYDENEIENIASFYSPTPGGVGPVNVTMLMKNLVEATEAQSAIIKR